MLLVTSTTNGNVRRHRAAQNYPMAWHVMALDMTLITAYYVKYSVLDCEILGIFHIPIRYES